MRILIIKIAAMGDILMSTPAIRAVRKAFPDADITVAIGESCRAALRTNPHVQNLHVIDDTGLYRGSTRRRLGVTLRLALFIRSRHFDLAFVFHRDWRFNLLTLLSGVRRRYGFARGHEGVGLTGGFEPPDGMHHIEQYLAIASLAGIPANGSEMEFHIGQAAEERASALLAERGIPVRAPLIGLAPGGARNVRESMDSRRWPRELYHKLAADLARLPDRRTLILGAESDRDVLFGLDPSLRHLHEFIGRTTLEETAALMKRCRAVVTNDSGPMHLASALRVPVVALFGPTDAREKRPLNPGSTHLWSPEGLACCPCYRDGRFPACPIGLECLRRITVSDVLARLEQIEARSIPQ